MPELFEETDEIEDDRLRLIFTCCHPALSLEGRVALTLRSLAGLTTAEIARAFLVPEADDGQAPDPRQARRSRPPGSPTACRPRICCRNAPAGCWRCST